MQEEDVIFVSSPQTFDPFMVDIYLSLYFGASLLMVANDIRCNSNALLEVLFPVDASKQNASVSIIQTTPSLFMRWTTNEIKNRVFSSNSQLRVLAFGGEPFPSTKTVTKWRNWRENTSTCLFNLYGLTEMSCWACFYKVQTEDIVNCKEIPIGTPIDEHTIIQIDANSEILLKSKVRKCFLSQLSDDEVFDNNYEWTLRTADLAEVDDRGRIFYKARINSVIKYFGQKIDLHRIEVIAKNNEGVLRACCVYEKQKNRIILFVTTNGHDDVIKSTKNVLKEAKFNVHIDIFPINDFPLSSHGKIDKKQLINAFNESKKTEIPGNQLHLVFMNLLRNVLGINIESFDGDQEPSTSRKKQKNDIDASFIFLGGTSLKAMQIIEDFEQITSKSFPNLLTMLFDEQKSIKEILKILSEESKNVVNEEIDENIENIAECLEIEYDWCVDFKKCIDATPTVCSLSDSTVVVSVGSHSKLLMNILLPSGKVLSKIDVPDRVESQVTQIDDYGIVGCYDGYLYCFHIKTGNIKWKFNSDGMIKCRPLIMNSAVIFGNYNGHHHNLWCVNANDGIKLWSQRIGSKSIFANPTKLTDDDFVVCTLDGIVARLNSKNSHVKWSNDMKKPIFSTPAIIKDENTSKLNIIFACVNGVVHCLRCDGELTWKFEIDGNIFSSFEYLRDSSNENRFDIFFGSHNHNIYCLTFDIQTQICTERWKFEANAPIRSTPRLFLHESKPFLINCCTNGEICVIDAICGRLIQKRKVHGDLFATPAIRMDNLIIGSRNNSLYSIDFSKNFLNRPKM